MGKTAVKYGYKNLTYDANIGKITWVNNLYVLGQGALVKPDATTVVYRDDLTSQQEAISDAGIPLPLDTLLGANIISVGSVLGVEYHVYPIASAPTESDTLIYIAYNIGGEVSNKYSEVFNEASLIKAEAATHADSLHRTDQQIIDIVINAGVETADYQTNLTNRIGAIIDEAMGSNEIDEALVKMKESWDKMQLSGDKKAELEAQFLNNLTSNVINSAIQTGASSMLSQKQADLAVRQKEGFDDNLLVKAAESYGNTIALINSGSSNASPANWTNFNNAIEELVTRSRG